MEIRSTGAVRETAQQVRRVILEDPDCFAAWGDKGLYPVAPLTVLWHERERWRDYVPELPADAGRLELGVMHENPSWVAAFSIEAVPGGALVRVKTGMTYQAGRLLGLHHARRSILPPHPAAVALLGRIAAELGRLGMLADQVVDHDEERGPRPGVEERVRYAHALLKTRKYSQTAALKKAHVDSRTYYRRCKQATGEDPIVPGLPE